MINRHFQQPQRFHVVNTDGTTVFRDGRPVRIAHSFGETPDQQYVEVGCHKVQVSALKRILELVEKVQPQAGLE